MIAKDPAGETDGKDEREGNDEFSKDPTQEPVADADHPPHEQVGRDDGQPGGHPLERSGHRRDGFGEVRPRSDLRAKAQQVGAEEHTQGQHENREASPKREPVFTDSGSALGLARGACLPGMGLIIHERGAL